MILNTVASCMEWELPSVHSLAVDLSLITEAGRPNPRSHPIVEMS